MTTRDECGCAKRAKQRDPTRPPRAKPCAVRARVNQELGAGAGIY